MSKFGFAGTIKAVLSPLRAIDQMAEVALQEARNEPCPSRDPVGSAIEELERQLARTEKLFKDGPRAV